MKLPQTNMGNGLNSGKFRITSIDYQAYGIYPYRKPRDELCGNIGGDSPWARGIKHKSHSIHTCSHSSIDIGWRT
jgi:hypothetical protein